jgi:leucyl aminopeptidase
MRNGFGKGLIISQSVCFARDLGNTPPNICTPSFFADRVKKNVSGGKVVCTVLSERTLKRMNMNGILSVSAGSHEPPCMVRLEHKPAKPVNKKPFVLVGKGITFDSGGLNIKTGTNMDHMKMDMSGGAAVAGIMKAASGLKLPYHLIGLIPLAENMPGNRAFKPGDIIRMSNGSTVEIMNTDAEGRLLLADAISYAQSFKPEVIIDIATLTGACVVALGPTAAGMLGTSSEWKERITSASVLTAERVWELPIWKENESLIKGMIADYKNMGNRWGGAITAAAFLKVFAGKTPWIHLDIAGPAYADDEHAYCAKHHASGFGIRLILEALMNL